jgi:hypothetical protein
LTTNLPSGSPVREGSTNFLGNFAATLAIFLLTYAFYISVTPSGLRDAEVLPLRSAEIADGILELHAGVSDYWFWGRSGSYLRTTVLPKLDHAARIDRRHTTIRIVIPDPGQLPNGVRYAAIKRGLGEKADENTLAAHVLATIFIAVTLSSRNPYLHVHIGLCSTVPVLRHDVSSSGALITRDARHLPAILVNASNPYFEMFRDAVENELAQSQPITWNVSDPALHQPGEISVESIIPAIHGMPCLSPTVIEEATMILESKEHRYA